MPAIVSRIDSAIAVEKRPEIKSLLYYLEAEVFDAYCAWMFPLLFEVEKRIDFTGMTPFEARVVGRLSERLMDTWIMAYEHGFAECPVVSMERTNWVKKGGGFLAAVDAAESMLYDAGFSPVRVRVHGPIARIELASEQIPLMAEEAMRLRILDAIKRLGFTYVTLDLAGFRSGSMNDVLAANDAPAD